MISQISQSDIDAHLQQRARLEPIARSVGLVYDEDNFLLLKALDTIAYEQKKAGVSLGGASLPRAGVPGSQIAAARAAVASLGVVQQESHTVTRDMGDAVVDILRARSGLPPLHANGGR